MNTSRRKKNIIFITILSVLGLLGAMVLQVTWIFNSYELIRNDIQKESYATIEKALEHTIRQNTERNRNIEWPDQ